MKKHLFILLLLVITFSFVKAQYRNSIWCFGDSAGIDFRNLSMPVPISTSLDTRGSCVSISDSLGNLLFYGNTRANGSIAQTGIIYNRNHDIMQNGDSIAGEGWYHELLIIPFPNDLNKFKPQEVLRMTIASINSNPNPQATVRQRTPCRLTERA